MPFSAASPLALLHAGAPLLPQLAASHFLHSFLMQLASTLLRAAIGALVVPWLPSPPQPALAPPDDAPEMMSIEIDMDTEASDFDEPLRAGTATLPFNPVTGAIITSPQPVDIDPLALEDDDAAPVEPPPPPPPPPPPIQAQPLPPLRHEYRATALSAHPAEVAAGDVTDTAVDLLLLGWESAMLRGLARSCGAPGVYAPGELWGRGQALVVKALILGEWVPGWVLFEGTLAAATFAGVGWFGYARRI